MANLYNKDGWIDFEKLEKLSTTLNIIIGPRNSGKTYGKMLYNQSHNIPYIFMRTTKNAIDTVFSENLSPFEKLNRDIGTRFCCAKIPKTGVIAVYSDYEELEDGRKKPVGLPQNFAIALSQVGSIRGFNMDYVPELIYDEFIKHDGEIIQNYSKTATMYFDIIVTLNRTREIQGKKPIKQWLFGNSDNLAVPLLQELRLIRPIISMQENNENYRLLKDRDIAIFLTSDSPNAALLKNASSISKILNGTSYSDMAFENRFINDDFENCIPQPLGQYVPLCVLENLMVMEHKKKDLIYIREYTGDNINGCTKYPNSKRGIESFKSDYSYLYFMFLNGCIYFSSYDEKIRFMRIFNID